MRLGEWLGLVVNLDKVIGRIELGIGKRIVWLFYG